jgi:hypothetical protein
LVFDSAGNLTKSWGGPGSGYDWPTSEHSIFVDAGGNVWITGNGPADRQAIKFTSEGKFIMQIGHPSKAPMNSLDTSMLGRPAGVEVDEKAHELYIADEYGNRRVIVFDSETGKFKRMWGAYGSMSNDTDPGPYDPGAAIDKQFRTPLHCVHLSNDGLVYVCDRVNDRIQVFTKEGKFLREFFLRKETLGNGSAYDQAFSRDSEQNDLLVADGENNVIWTMRRSDGSILGSTGHAGRNAGQFHHVHEVVADSKPLRWRSGNREAGSKFRSAKPMRSLVSSRPERTERPFVCRSKQQIPRAKIGHWERQNSWLGSGREGPQVSFNSSSPRRTTAVLTNFCRPERFLPSLSSKSISPLEVQEC